MLDGRFHPSLPALLSVWHLLVRKDDDIYFIYRNIYRRCLLWSSICAGSMFPVEHWKASGLPGSQVQLYVHTVYGKVSCDLSYSFFMIIHPPEPHLILMHLCISSIFLSSNRAGSTIHASPIRAHNRLSGPHPTGIISPVEDNIEASTLGAAFHRLPLMPDTN